MRMKTMKNRMIICAIAVIASTSAALAGPRHLDLPVDPNVTQETIYSTICVSGYSRTVRPPQAYTQQIKQMRLREAGLPPEAASEYELDHIISISSGGAPSDPRNLKLQPWPIAKQKDRF